MRSSSVGRITSGRRGQLRLAEHISVNGRAYLSGMLPIVIGFAAGWVAVRTAGGTAYFGAAQSSMNSLINGSADLFIGILRGLWIAVSAYAMIAVGGLFWAVSPVSALFMALWAFPFGCAVPLLTVLGAKGVFCAVLCVMLPMLFGLPIFLRAWANMLRGARASLHAEKQNGYAKKMLFGALWLLPYSIFQCAVMPLLFRGICSLFFK